MPASYKPDGYGDVSPYLIVDGAERTIAFLVAAFGARELRRFADDEGTIRRAEVRLGDSTIMLSSGAADYPPIACHVHVYVPDVDAAYAAALAAALAAGAESVAPPAKGGDADRRGGVRDAGGTTWWIGTMVE